ncbi:MAG: DUF1073 domain-containing protein [Clostridiales bacterium]|nr:DUF1073 domain-containing protein [Clostridiales bacterium]
MSSKRNRTRFSRKQAVRPEQKPVSKAQVTEDLLAACDGYSNAAAFIGEDSPLMSSGTFVRSGLTSQTELLTTTYRVSWLAKRIIDMPSEDMTRAWYRLSTSLPEEDLDSLRRLEAKHSVKQEITNAIRWGRLYGGAIAVMVIRGDEDRLEEPLDYDTLLPGCFQGLLVLDRAQGISPSLELVSDLDDPDFGYPEYYTVDLELGDLRSVRIHHSRVLRFIGRELPRTETVRENYWGASELEHIWDELQKRSAASANIAQLIFQANITTLKMGDFGGNLAGGSDRMREKILQTMQNENRLRTSYGIQVMSADDSMETHTYSFAGLSDIYESFMMDMAGAAEIPATKLFGRSPQGFNSTGESDLRNYYDMIAQSQERKLRPALEKLMPVMVISCWGYMPEDLEIVFEPVMTTSPAERAELVSKLSSDVIQAFQAGLLTREEALAELKSRGEELGVYTKI